MAELPHARRSLLQAVYARSLTAHGAMKSRPKPWVKRAYLAGVRARPEELEHLRAALTKSGKVDSAAASALAKAIDAVNSHAPPATDTIGAFAAVPDDALVSFAEALAAHRQAQTDTALKAFRAISTRAQGANHGSNAGRGAGASPLSTWLMAAKATGAETESVLAPLRTYSGSAANKVSPDGYENALGRASAASAAAVIALKQCITVDPVGYLFLERVDFTPAGIERGELAASIPLAPDEQVQVAHKDWSLESEDFAKTTQDYQESFSEQGVTEKAELTQATISQTMQSMGLGTGVSATGGYGPVSVTATAGFSLQSMALQTEAFSRAQTMETTRKAAARSRKDFKTSFRVLSEAGAESTTAQQIKNPYADKAARVDYYRLVRRWLVQVRRYGLRLTYDLVLPEPGVDLLDKYHRMELLSSLLQEGFDAAGAFPLKPSDLTHETYTAKAAELGAYVPAPPPLRKTIEQVLTRSWKSIDDAKRREYQVLEIDVDQDYVVEEVPIISKKSTQWKDHEGDSVFRNTSLQSMKGKTGRLSTVIATQYLGTMYAVLRATTRLRDEVLRDWQLKAWAVLRDAAVAKYEERRQGYKEELAQLRESLAGQDGLSLRRIEREEIMKGVLRWLFGPDFQFVKDGTPADLYGADGAVFAAPYMKVVAQGDLIRFLHQAIEWENVLYFLYPYFWSSLERWDLKKELDHPDALHRAFLRSGAARVVLTIRPGFERDFLAWMAEGAAVTPKESHDYLSIVDEMEAYAKTNFPGLPAASPDAPTDSDPGQLVGAWYEYTPTGALDIAFGETMPVA